MVKKMRKKVMTAIALLPVFAVSNQNFSSSNFLTSSAEAVQLRDGKTYFVQLPLLLGAETTINRIYSWNATYYFAIALPQNMGEPLEKLEISQTEGLTRLIFIAIKQLLICNLHQEIELPSLVKLSCCQAKIAIAQKSQLLLIPQYLRAMSLTLS